MAVSDNIPLLLQQLILQYIRKNAPTPCILISKDIIEKNIRCLIDEFNFAPEDIFFSLKANYDNIVIEKLRELGTGFEIGSAGELKKLTNKNINNERIINSNPVKMPEHITQCYAYGVRTYAFDCISELEKLAEYAPNSKVFIRLKTSNKGAKWELTGKFGASRHDVLLLFNRAVELGLIPYGISMHCGWNNTDLKTWNESTEQLSSIALNCKKTFDSFHFVDIGGGFPAHNVDQYKILNRIASHLKPVFTELRNHKIRIISEPGSFVIANAAVMLTQIYDIVERNNKKWVYIDTGVFQGFYWILSGLRYQVSSCNKKMDEKNYETYIITGPTLDSHDVFTKNAILPASIKKGDYLVIYPAGAYISSAQSYNGFNYPQSCCKI